MRKDWIRIWEDRVLDKVIAVILYPEVLRIQREGDMP